MRRSSRSRDEGCRRIGPLSRWFPPGQCSTYKVIKGNRWGGHEDTLWGQVAFMGMSRAAPESSGSRLEAAEYLCVFQS